MTSENSKIAKLVSDAIEDYQDGNLDESQIADLRKVLAERPEARQAFCEHNFFRDLASSTYLLENASNQTNIGQSIHSKSLPSRDKNWIALALAASLLVGIAITVYSWSGTPPLIVLKNLDSETSMAQGSFRPESPASPVAVLLDATNATWKSQGLTGASGIPLRRGWLELISGTAPIRFDCGAVATLIGPSRFQIIDAKHGFLASGDLVVNVPEHANGFKVDTNAMRLTDLGTEFGIRVNEQDETEVHVIKGLVEVECEMTEDSSKTFAMKENEAKKFVNHVSHNELPLDRSLAEKIVPSRPDQRIGYYTFRSNDDGNGVWTTDPSAKTIGGKDIVFQDFFHVGVEPGPIEFTKNLNRWSFKSWRKNSRDDEFYVGFTVSADHGKLIHPNRLSLELFRAGGNEKPELAPQDGVLRVSSDGFKTHKQFILLENDSFVREPKFVSAELGILKPAAQYEFRFLFKGQSKARAIRLDEVTLDLDVIDANQ